MNRLTNWLDGLVEQLCHWLNDAVSGRRRLAHLGDGLAGVHGGAPLPVDRRLNPTILENHWNQNEMADPSHLITGSDSNDWHCGFWAYCHMGETRASGAAARTPCGTATPMQANSTGPTRTCAAPS